MTTFLQEVNSFTILQPTLPLIAAAYYGKHKCQSLVLATRRFLE
jgi:hypothetical protein